MRKITEVLRLLSVAVKKGAILAALAARVPAAF